MWGVSSLPPLVAGRYRPLRELGRGGMGVVYAVEHVHTGEQLALKVLSSQAGASPNAVERFKREARVPAQIKSDHVVRVTDADVAPELGALFLVMELLEGSDLDQLSAGKPQRPAAVCDWYKQIGRGLEKAHKLGIVHRDLKPENLFLTRREDGSDLVKILDFGIAKFVLEASGQGHATETGNIVGSPRYMAPEQATGEVSRIGPPADVWALGMIAFRLLSGRDYWNGPTVAALIGQIVYAPMPAPSECGLGVGAAFDDWFARSCARDPATRWPDVNQQVEALSRALSGAEPVIAESTIERIGAASTLAVTPAEPSGSLVGAASGVVPSAPPLRSPRRAALAGGVAAVLVIGGGAWWWSADHRGSPAAPAPTEPLSAPASPAVGATSAATATPAPTPATSASAEPLDAGQGASADAGRAKKPGTRKPGDPYGEQY